MIMLGITIANVVFPLLSVIWAWKTVLEKPAKVFWGGLIVLFVSHICVNAYFFVYGG